MGDGLVPVALAFAVLSVDRTPSALGFVLASRFAALVPTLLAAGVIADRTPRKAVMIASDLIRLVAQAGTATLLLTRSAHLWELMVLAALYGFGEALFRPTSTGFIPEVVPAARLQQAMALLATATSVSTVVGPAIAGVLVIALSPGWAIGVDAVTFAASAMLLLGVPSKLSVRRSVPTVWSDLREGWTMFRSRKWLWVDGIYRGQLVEWVARYMRFVLRVTLRPEGWKGFVLLPRRWVVERTLAWLNQSRRLSKDYERLPKSSEALIYLSMTRLMLRRLTAT